MQRMNVSLVEQRDNCCRMMEGGGGDFDSCMEGWRSEGMRRKEKGGSETKERRSFSFYMRRKERIFQPQRKIRQTFLSSNDESKTQKLKRRRRQEKED